MKHTLKQIHLQNFKCFSDHTIHFDDTTIMIGQNNAGKTTVVEALRIIGLATARFRSATAFYTRPDWLEPLLPLATKGLKISAKVIDTDLEQVFYQYNEPPAIIEAQFTDDIDISVYINSETELFAVFSQKGNPLYSRKRLNEAGVPDVRVLPQIVPLTKEEIVVARETLQGNQFSKRTSRNFRNNLLVAHNEGGLDQLQQMISATWPRIQIHEVVREKNIVYLQLRDGDYVTEIYFMGHGIQMWIQTLWFIVSSSKDAIIVLDEPDVYMHADLQRKLIRLLCGEYAQVIIATHSIEIISEVLPDNILIIDRNKPESLLADSYPVLQTAISGMGSIHNITLSRLLNNKKYLYVEGEDVAILRILYDTLYSRKVDPLDHIPSVKTGGWGSWDAQKDNAEQLLHTCPDLRIFFLYDRDYHTEAEVQDRIRDAISRGLFMHIWDQKEIENYLIVVPAIARFICGKNPSLDYSTVCSEIDEHIDEFCNSMKRDLIYHIIGERQKREKGKDVITIGKDVESEVEKAWGNREARLALIPGKKMIKDLSVFCKNRYNVSFSALQIASGLQEEEISPEIKKLLADLHN